MTFRNASLSLVSLPGASSGRSVDGIPVESMSLASHAHTDLYGQENCLPLSPLSSHPSRLLHPLRLSISPHHIYTVGRAVQRLSGLDLEYRWG